MLRQILRRNALRLTRPRRTFLEPQDKCLVREPDRRSSPSVWPAVLLIALFARAAQTQPSTSGDEPYLASANRLIYLDSFCDPYYVGLHAPRLVTPQWVGEPGVEGVVTWGIDDMREPEKYESFLRPLLERLKAIDGRAPVSIMTNQVDPEHPQLQTWLREGLSLETHTVDHPCPCLKDGDFSQAKSTFDRCVDQLSSVPNSHPVAFRFPCMDSLNTPSPRAYSEIFNSVTPLGNFLQISSSVTCLFTPDDSQLPRDLAFDSDGRPRFAKYVPFPNFINKVENYPYPYVIGHLCWEFPCAVPDDWQGQNLQQPNNPRTVADHKRYIDAVMLKRGVANFVFHPHGWIRNSQLVDVVDYAVERYGSTIKFLNFRECAQRLQQNLLGGQALRSTDGEDNGVRLIDLNNDGYLDVVVGNAEVRQTRLWNPQTQQFQISEFPSPIVHRGPEAATQIAVRFGVLHPDFRASCLVADPEGTQVWHFQQDGWQRDRVLERGLETAELSLPPHQVLDPGVRLRDVDGDGICELLLLSHRRQTAWKWNADMGRWVAGGIVVPEGAQIVDDQGRDAGLRFVDLNQDRLDDMLVSNAEDYAIHLFNADRRGWTDTIRRGHRTDPNSIPPIVRHDGNNGVWFAEGFLWVQNEQTDQLPDGIDRRSFEQLLAPGEPD